MVSHNVMKYCVAVLVGAEDVLDAIVAVEEVFAVLDAAVVDVVRVVVVVATTELVLELVAIPVAGMHWSMFTVSITATRMKFQKSSCLGVTHNSIRYKRSK